MIKLGKLVIILAISTIFVSPSASAARYFFSQGGFDHDGSGGRVTGSFEAVDIADAEGRSDENGMPIPDGKILFCPGKCPDTDNYYHDKVSAFEIKFTGNPFFEGLNKLQYAQLTGLDYNINTNMLDIYYGTNGGIFQYSSALVVMLALPDPPYLRYGNVTEPMFVTQVPLTGALGLFAPSLLGLGLLHRRRTKLTRFANFIGIVRHQPSDDGQCQSISL